MPILSVPDEAAASFQTEKDRKINKLVDLGRAKPAFMKTLQKFFRLSEKGFVLQGTNQVKVLLKA